MILVINPGSTSTKLALFDLGGAGGRGRGTGRGLRLVDERTVAHSAAELRRFRRVADQEGFRARLVERYLVERGVGVSDLVAVVGRGGLLRPLAGGTYRVGAKMLRDLRAARFGEHACNLGAPLAADLARAGNCPAFVVDPVVVDELAPEARLSGLPELPRRSVFHALSQKAAARLACQRLGVRYERARLVVAHLGGGISVGAHRLGRVVEVNNALDGEGPMAAERAGTLPAGDLVRLATGGRTDRAGLLRRITGGGGLVAHLGTNDLRQIERRAARGERRAALLMSALAYGISKAMCACLAALGSNAEAMVLTGGMCRCRPLVREIRRRLGRAAPVMTFPENLEMRALAEGALRVLRGQERARSYG